MEALESLLPLTQSMCAAAASGDFEQVEKLFAVRQAQLDALLKQGLDPGMDEVLRQVLAQDKELVCLMLEEQNRIRLQLAALRANRRAHQAYMANR